MASKDTTPQKPSRASKLAPRASVHLLRKIWHSVLGSGMAYGLYSPDIDDDFVRLVLMTLFLTITTAELLRLEFPWFNEHVMGVFSLIMRDSEATRMSGTPFYLAGVALTAAVFPKDIAILAILCLAIGDPMASLVGVTIGTNVFRARWPSGKSVAGSIACFAVCLFCGVKYLAWSSSTLVADHNQRIVVAGAGALAASVAEALVNTTRSNFPDDNVLVPIFAAGTLIAHFSQSVALNLFGAPVVLSQESFDLVRLCGLDNLQPE